MPVVSALVRQQIEWIPTWAQRFLTLGIQTECFRWRTQGQDLRGVNTTQFLRYFCFRFGNLRVWIPPLPLIESGSHLQPENKLGGGVICYTLPRISSQRFTFIKKKRKKKKIGRFMKAMAPLLLYHWSVDFRFSFTQYGEFRSLLLHSRRFWFAIAAVNCGKAFHKNWHLKLV